MMKRRDFLKVGSAGVAGTLATGTSLFGWTSRAEAATITKTYYITNGMIAMPDFTSVYFMGFSESAADLNVPAVPMWIQQGDTVVVTIHNTLNTTHSFKIDGVVDTGPIGGGQSATVSFVANNPGTYLFYDGVNDPYNRVCGLHGAMAVVPSSGNELYSGSPTFVQQQIWVHNDIDPRWNDAVRQGQTPNVEYTPRYFTLNGMTSRPPGAPGDTDPSLNAMINTDTALHGHVGDRCLVRNLNAGMCSHAVHCHGNHMEWLASNNQPRPVWMKDIIPLQPNRGTMDMIYPFESPPDAWPPAPTGCYPMHLHDEMSQTAAGGNYMFGSMTDIYFE
jgi:hypothetical protein